MKLEDRIAELQARVSEQSEVLHAMQAELREAQDELHKQLLDSIDERHRLMYIEKLTDVRDFVRSRMAKHRRMFDHVNWAFREHREPYTNDWHDVIADPLDIAVAEFDLIDMGPNFDVRIDVTQESVKRFVQDWMRENFEEARYDSDLFAFKD